MERKRNLYERMHQIINNLSIDDKDYDDEGYRSTIDDFIGKWVCAIDAFDIIAKEYYSKKSFHDLCNKYKFKLQIEEIYEKYRSYIDKTLSLPKLAFPYNYAACHIIKERYESIYLSALRFTQDYKNLFYDYAEKLRLKINIDNHHKLIESFENAYKEKIFNIHGWIPEREMINLCDNLGSPINTEEWTKRLRLEIEAYKCTISNQINDPKYESVDLLGDDFMLILRKEKNILDNIKNNIDIDRLFDYKTLLKNDFFISKISSPDNFIYLIYRINTLLVKINPSLNEQHNQMLGITDNSRTLNANQELMKEQELFSLLETILMNLLSVYKEGLPCDKNGKKRGKPNYSTSVVLDEIKSKNKDFEKYNTDLKNIANIISLALQTDSIGNNITAKDIATIARKYTDSTIGTLETLISKAKKGNLK